MLVERGLVSSRSQAQELIGAGRVTVDGAPAPKPSRLVTRASEVVVRHPAQTWASRGGHKLAGALADLDVDPAGLHCLDAGASTGGFTDVLLSGGARRVVAVDVGYGQLVWRLRQDPRVVVIERTNVRHLSPDDVRGPLAELVVADLSFISLRTVLPALVGLATADARFLLMVKPQFEGGPARVGRGGVVRAPHVWRAVLAEVVAGAAQLGLGLGGVAVSRLPGPAGNREFFLLLGRGLHVHAPDAVLDEVVSDAASGIGAVTTGQATQP